MPKNNIHNFTSNDDGKNKGNNGGNNGNAGGNNTGGTTSGGFPVGAVMPNPNHEDVLDILINLNEKAKNGEFQPLLHRDDQMRQLLRSLKTHKKPNALLTGDAGVGKTGLVEELARLIVTDDPIVSSELKGYTIYELPIYSIAAGKSYVGQLEQSISDIIDFAEDPENKAIIFMDEIHQIMSGSAVNERISQALKPALSRSGIRMIGATTTQESKKLMDDPAFNRRWSETIVPELTVDQTIDVLISLKSFYQKAHNVAVNDDILRALVPIADEYAPYGSHRPDSAITLMDKAMVHARLDLLEKKITLQQTQNGHMIQLTATPVLTLAHVKQTALTLVGRTSKQPSKALSDLTYAFDHYLIGQDNAKTKIIDTVKRIQLGLSKSVKPHSFLFAGPTGTGKTEIAKQVAKALFGSETALININMTEYSHSSALTRITGSSAGYVGSDSNRELPFDSLRSNPFQVVLLDEFEKADTSVQQYFMQALDEGKTKTAFGVPIDFSRTIIIATTNAGVEELSAPSIGFNANEKASKTDVLNALKQHFKIELINRFEHVIAFDAITKDEFTQILAVKYNKAIKNAIESRPDLTFTPDVIDVTAASSYDRLVELSESFYSPQLNGRPAEKTIQEYIENFIIDNHNNTQFNLL